MSGKARISGMMDASLQEVDEVDEKQAVVEDPTPTTQDAPAGSANGDAAIKKAATSRLMIVRMELENFKSYYGQKSIGPFHKRFTSVVGPNGSGKSNTIDALLFVFGKKSSKLRAKKLAEMIHSSDQHPDVEKATVVIHFQLIIDHVDDEDAFDVVEGSGFTISRTVTRKGAHYRISGKRCTRDDVEKTLLKHEVDLNNNRFLILQGEVESISLMKPKAQTAHEEGFLEYLEDIIGTQKYVAPLKKTEAEGDRLTEQVQEKLNRVKMVEKDRDTLKEARNEAIDCIRMEVERDILTAQCKQVSFYRAKKGEAASQERYQVVARELDEEKVKTKDLKEELEQIMTASGSKRVLVMRIQRVLEQRKTNYNDCEAKDRSMREERRNLKKLARETLKNITRIAEELQQDKTRLVECDELIPESKRLVAALTKTLDKEDKTLDRLRSQVEKRIAPLKEKKGALEKRLIPLKDVVNEKLQTLRIAQDGISEITDRRAKALERFREAQQKHDSIKQSEIQMNTKNLERINKEQEHIQHHRNEMCNQIEVFQQELVKYRGKLENITVKREEAETDLRQQREGGGIAAQMHKAQKDGHIRGFHGRLGDLGSIDPKFDIAVSTKGAKGLNFLVMETTKNATRAMKYLKANEIGRTTFLCLDKISKRCEKYLQKPKDLPPGAQRLLDHVKCDAKYKTGFAFVLRNCLIAKDGRQAQKYAFKYKKRWNVVTLSGQIIASSGVMSGGGRPMQGLLGGKKSREIKYTREDLEALVKKMQKYKDALFQLKQEVRVREKEVGKLTARLESVAHALERALDNQKRLQERLVTLEKTMPALEKAAKGREDTAQLEGLKAQIGPARQSVDKAERACTELERDIKNLEMEMMAQGGKKLQEMEQAVEQYRTRRTDAEATINQCQADIKTLKKSIAKNEKKQKAADHTLQQQTADLKNAKVESRRIEDQALQALQEVQITEQELKMAEKGADTDEGATQQKQSQYNELAKRRVELEDEFKRLEGRLYHLRTEMKQSNLELNALAATIQRKELELYQICPEIRPDEPAPAADGEPGAAAAMDVDETDAQSAAAEIRPELKQRGLVAAMEHVKIQGKVRKHTAYRQWAETQLGAITDETLNDMRARIEAKKDTLEKMEVNMNAVEQYKIKNKEYNLKWQELEAVKALRRTNREAYEKLRKQRLEMFMEGFTIITEKLKEMYRMLTFGGDAELELVDSIDPFSEGVQFSVRPPKKSWKVISNLSGGEKTLASMALVFALHHFRPTPLYCMDEIDAALDFKNVSIVANYIKDRTKNAQFIIISLRNNMFELANRLVGIYKQQNQSHSLSIDPGRFEIRSQAMIDAQHSQLTQEHAQWEQDAASHAGDSMAGDLALPPIGEEGESQAGGTETADAKPVQQGEKRMLSPNAADNPNARKRQRMGGSGLQEIDANEL